MHLAFATAMQDDHDGYLWLNDDVVLDPDALRRLLETWERMYARAPHENIIVIGSTRDPESGKLTYGGLRRISRIRPLTLGRVEPHVAELEVDAFEGNFAYIPAGTAQAVGNLDPKLLCAGGDTDYGLRARGLGIRIWLMPGTIGCCQSNPSSEFWCAPGIGIRERWRRKNDPVRGLPWVYAKHFARRHGGPLWLLYLLWAYRRLVWPTERPPVPTLANTTSRLGFRGRIRRAGGSIPTASSRN
jgi:GT2 family glycosyltransferase